MRSIRGNEIAMIFQEPMTSLNPVFTVGEQIVEAIRLHEGLSRRAAMRQGGRDARAGAASRTRSAGWTTTRTSSRAACASG